MTRHSIVQKLLLPGLEFAAPADMYARMNEHVTPHLARRELSFRPGGHAAFDTFFNGVSVGVWKRATLVESLRFVAEGQGRYILRVGLHRIGCTQRWLTEHEIELSENGRVAVDLPWLELEDGLLYVALEAVSEGVISGGHFETETVPAREVRLGVVITHFNRKPFVVPAIRRIREELLERPDFRHQIELIVVDNSRNLTPEEAAGATMIPNANYGGSGGFTRGLLHLIDSQRFTHCLFMDDDASCEIESIRRAYALQRFARTPALAVSGALLREVEPYRLFEKGGIYRRNQLGPRQHWSDVRDVGTLMRIEQDDMRTDYGAWWFFCFALEAVNRFPFPFFVRGDDALFSLLNRFEIETMNGIACWGEDFQLKENPSTRYLGLRSTLAILLMKAHSGRLHVFRLMLGWFLSSLLSYNYASAEAITKAIGDVIRGPQFWRDNMDMSTVRALLAPLNAQEKLIPLRLAEHEIVLKPPHERRFQRLVRLLTLNGFLLPDSLVRDVTVRDEKGFRATLRRIFLARHVLFMYEPLGVGYIATHDKKRFRSVVASFFPVALRFLRNQRELERAYRAALPEMTSEAFWRKVYEAELREQPETVAPQVRMVVS